MVREELPGLVLRRVLASSLSAAAIWVRVLGFPEILISFRVHMGCTLRYGNGLRPIELNLCLKLRMELVLLVKISIVAQFHFHLFD